MDQTLVQNLISALILAVVGAVAFGLRSIIAVGIEYLRSKIGNEGVLAVKEYAQTVVRYLEQSPVYKNFGGEKKKELAMLWVEKFAAEKGLPMDHDFIDRVIEECVQIMNAEMVKLDIGGDYAGDPVEYIEDAITDAVVAAGKELGVNVDEKFAKVVVEKFGEVIDQYLKK